MIRKITDDSRRLDMRDGEEVVEITRDWFSHLLNCVPPIRQEYYSFFVGEPVDHVLVDGDPVPRFRFCFRHCGSYYATSPKMLGSGSNTKIINDMVRLINRLNIIDK